MSDAAADSEPLLGIAMRNGSLAEPGWFDMGVPPVRGSEVGVDVVECDATGKHQHLRVVQQLTKLRGRALSPLVLGGHPGLGGLLHQLLADRVYSGVELLDR